MNPPKLHRATAWVLAALTTATLLAGLDRLATSQHAAAAAGAAGAAQWLVARDAPVKG